MRRSFIEGGRPLLRVMAVLAAALSFTRSTSALAAPFDVRGQDWEGLSQLVGMAQAQVGKGRVVLGSTLDLRRLDRADALIIVHPQRRLAAGDLSAFMRAGGRIVMLDDYGAGDSLLSHFGIRRVPLPLRPSQMLRDNPALAIAEPAGTHSVVRDVAHVVTNHATGLAHDALSPVLVVRGDGEPDVLLALAGSVGHGRLLAIGDASIPMNAMLRYPGNLGLSRAIIRYATEQDAWHTGEGNLYVLVNDFETIGTLGSAFGGDPGAEAAMRRFGDMLEDWRRAGLPPPLAYAAALALALGVLFWTALRAGKTHKASTPRFTRAVPVAAQGGVAGHAAAVGAREAARGQSMLELKSALEEHLSTRLGLERTLTDEQLVGKARAAGLVDEDEARTLARLLSSFSKVEAALGARQVRRRAIEGLRDGEVVAIAERVRNLLASVEARQRDRVLTPP